MPGGPKPSVPPGVVHRWIGKYVARYPLASRNKIANYLEKKGVPRQTGYKRITEFYNKNAEDMNPTDVEARARMLAAVEDRIAAGEADGAMLRLYGIATGNLEQRQTEIVINPAEQFVAMMKDHELVQEKEDDG